eukprot:COSAG01_NODE_4913_length_4631_cov_6.907767_3_plen_1045_part_00
MLIVRPLAVVCLSLLRICQSTEGSWCGGGAPAWSPAWTGGDILASSVSLVLSVAGDIEDAVARGCVDRRSHNFDPSSVLDDGSCERPSAANSGCTDHRALNYARSARYDDHSCVYAHGVRPCDAVAGGCAGLGSVVDRRCFLALDFAWMQCGPPNGDACAPNCSAAVAMATMMLQNGTCNATNSTAAAAAAASSTSQTPNQLVGALVASVQQVNCSAAAVFVTVTAAATFQGAVSIRAFQQSIAAAMSGAVQADDVTITSYTQTASAAIMIPGSASAFNASSAANLQFIMAIGTLYGGRATVSIVSVTAAAVPTSSGRRLMAQVGSWSEETSSESGVQIDYQVSLESSTPQQIAAFNLAAASDVQTLCSALNSGPGQYFASLSADQVLSVPATVVVEIQFALILDADSLSEAYSVANSISAVLGNETALAYFLGRHGANVTSLKTDAIDFETTCGDGHFLSTAFGSTASQCVLCPPGRVRDAVDADTACIICPHGFAPSRRKDECIVCPAGFSSLSGMGCELALGPAAATADSALPRAQMCYGSTGATILSFVTVSFMLSAVLMRMHRGLPAVCWLPRCEGICSSNRDAEYATLSVLVAVDGNFGISAALLSWRCASSPSNSLEAEYACGTSTLIAVSGTAMLGAMLCQLLLFRTVSVADLRQGSTKMEEQPRKTAIASVRTRAAPRMPPRPLPKPPQVPRTTAALPPARLRLAGRVRGGDTNCDPSDEHSTNDAEIAAQPKAHIDAQASSPPVWQTPSRPRPYPSAKNKSKNVFIARPEFADTSIDLDFDLSHSEGGNIIDVGYSWEAENASAEAAVRPRTPVLVRASGHHNGSVARHSARSKNEQLYRSLRNAQLRLSRQRPGGSSSSDSSDSSSDSSDSSDSSKDTRAALGNDRGSATETRFSRWAMPRPSAAISAEERMSSAQVATAGEEDNIRPPSPIVGQNLAHKLGRPAHISNRVRDTTVHAIDSTTSAKNNCGVRTTSTSWIWSAVLATITLFIANEICLPSPDAHAWWLAGGFVGLIGTFLGWLCLSRTQWHGRR